MDKVFSISPHHSYFLGGLRHARMGAVSLSGEEIITRPLREREREHHLCFRVLTQSAAPECQAVCQLRVGKIQKKLKFLSQCEIRAYLALKNTLYMISKRPGSE